MKSSRKMCFLFFLLSASIGYAQDFFPLKVGNIYQFRKEYEYATPWGGYESTSFFVSEVILDTTISEKTFFKFSNTPLGNNRLFSYDSTLQQLFVIHEYDDTIRLAVDFNLPADSVFTSYIYGPPEEFLSEGSYVRSVFGDSVLTYSIFNMRIGPDGPQRFYFSDGLGLIQNKWTVEDISSREVINEYIISAIVNFIAYNPIELDIDYIAPLMDRPINSFPFVLTGACSIYDPDLIDSFYVDILHIRSDSTINSWKLNLREGAINLPIYQGMLEVGDMLRVRATATEISFYQNIAYYPDSGWAVINVLPSTVDVSDEYQILKYSLNQNYPNPFNPSTKISFSVSKPGRVQLTIFDPLGNEIQTLIDEYKAAGNYEIEFDGSSLNSGIYFYRLISGEYINARKMILIK